MANNQQNARPSGRWQQAGYDAGVGLKRLCRSWAVAEQRLVLKAGEHAHWMRLGLLLLKILVAVGIAAVVAVGAVIALWAVAIVVGVMALAMLNNRCSCCRHHWEDDGIFDDGFNTAWRPWDYWKS